MSNMESIKCSTCLFEFESLELFIRHLHDLFLDNEQTHRRTFYKCNYCSFECYGNENFASHLENTHLIFQNNDSFPTSSTTKNTGKTFKNECEYCKRCFLKPSDLLRHIRIHKGEKPFKCQTCKREFRIKSTLDTHLKTHKKIQQNELIQCTICEKNFLSLSALKIHFRIHTNDCPFKCEAEDCCERFRTKKHMKAHFRRIHLKEGEETLKSDDESILAFKNSILESLKHFSKLDGFNLVPSKNSAFNKVSNTSQELPQPHYVNNISALSNEKQEIVIRVQLRSGSVIGDSSYGNLSLITTINIDVKALINYAGKNMLMPLKRAGLPINLTLSLNPLAVLNKITQLIQSNPSINFFTAIVSPTTQPHLQSPLNPVPFSILVPEEADTLNCRRHMPSFLIECFFAPSNGNQECSNDPMNRQILAQSCLPMLYNTETYNTNDYDRYLGSSRNIEFQTI